MEIFGYTFANDALLEEALTTPSCRMEHPSSPDNQRLEFLGDAVLGLLSAVRVYTESPSAHEGSLTVRRTHMVSAAALCASAARFDFAARLRRNRGAEPLDPKSKTIADAIEAVIGAAYLDGGFDAARTIFDTLDLTAHADEGSWSVNPKGELQIRAQAQHPPQHPAYELLKVTGRAHAPKFTMRVKVAGLGEATATAGSRREAEAAAAADLLQQIAP